MKTIQFTGTQYKIDNLHLALGISDNDMPQQSETRVYIVDTNTNHLFNGDFSDENFMTIAEEQGTVYTLKGFQEAFNNLNVDISSAIRFINVMI